MFTTALLGLTGCSYLFVSGPSARDRKPPPGTYGPVSCSTNYVAPLLDVLLTGFQVARTVIAVNHSEADYQGMALSRGADIGFGVGLTALAGTSAIYGFNAVSECRTVDATRPEPEPAALRLDVARPKPESPSSPALTATAAVQRDAGSADARGES